MIKLGIMTSSIFRSHIHWQAWTKWAVVCLQSLINSRDPFLSRRWRWSFLSVCILCSAHFPLEYLLFLLPPLEPPEAYIDNEHDEKDPTGCQFSIGGAGIQILGVAPVLLWQAGQVAGLGVKRCREEKSDEREQEFKTKEERREEKNVKEAHRMGHNHWIWGTLQNISGARAKISQTYQKELRLFAAPPLCSPPWSSVHPEALCWCCPDSFLLGCQCTTSWFFGCRCLLREHHKNKSS